MKIEANAPPKRKKKTLRLPNGFGSISYLGAKRRKPYVARIFDHTEINDEKMTTTAVYKSLGTYRTWDEAFMVLAKYNENPYDIDASNMTFKECYDQWFEEYSTVPIKGVLPSKSTLATYRMAIMHSKEAWDVKLSDIKPLAIQKIVSECGLSASGQATIIKMFSLVFKYAMRLEIVDRLPTIGVRVTKQQEQVGSVLTHDEIQSVWEMSRSRNRDMVLFLLYTGMRIGEISTITEIHDDYIVGGNKTKESKNRIIPLHHAIREIARDVLSDPASPTRVREWFKANMPTHTPHDCRRTFITRCEECGVNPVASRKITGHSAKDVHEGVYTRLSKDYLLSEIEKIEY